MKIKELKNKLIKKWYRYRILKSLIRKYREDLELSNILVGWITKRILDGQKGRRQELVNMQSRLKESETFLDYLKEL